MWSEFKLMEVASRVFGSICNQINQRGYIENRSGAKYFTIIAPCGGKRCYEVNLEWLESIVDGWNEERAKWEMAKDIVGQLSFASFGSTPLLELTDEDRVFFDGLTDKLFSVIA
ncbi:hypothetical protein [Limosilactobacillus antri]|uniref:hypothetical protein n=1 Tax=Limosilactobacillus antri TaxID=227943 RepID=UPI001F5982D5|nr:hypothetical protein [Limosilactobacillus antri]